MSSPGQPKILKVLTETSLNILWKQMKNNAEKAKTSEDVRRKGESNWS
jgi:hypothetical protein